MGIYFLRPNADVSTVGTFTRFGAPITNFASLSDTLTTTGITSTGGSERSVVVGLVDATGTIPAGEVIIAVTPYLQLFDSRNTFFYWTPFDAAVGIFSAGFAVSEGAQFVSQVGGTSFTTVNGPRCTTPPGQPNVSWSFAALDALQLQIKSRISTNYYDAYVVVETITAGAVTVSAPTGTISDRGPSVTWAYSIGQQNQAAANIKVFTSAQYSAVGFDPLVSTALTNSIVNGSSTTLDLFYDPKDGSASYGTILPDGAYRAYVWVNQLGTVTWYGGTFTAFTVADAVSAPTMTTPVANSTTTTGTPTLKADYTAQVGGATKRVEFQLSSDSGFVNSLQTLLDPTVRYSGTGQVTVAAASKLAQGTWYARARGLDQFGTYGAYSAGQSFVVSHTPSASNLTPSLGLSAVYATTKALSWTFSDPSTSDVQTAYQVQVGKGSVTTATIDSGVVVSALTSYTATIDATYKDIDIWWRVRVRDGDNVFSNWSDTAIFHASDLPVCTITNPANAAVITTPTPTLAWTFAASGGRTQSAWRAYILNTTANPDVIVADSGWVVGTGVTWTPSLPIVDLATNYTAHVELKDNNGLIGIDDNIFTATYTQPDAFNFVVTSTTYTTDGLVSLAWPAAVADATFVGWRVYRRPVGGTYKLLRTITVATTKVWADYTAPSNIAVEYAIIQAATRFGLVVESPYQATTFQADNQNYMLVCPDNPALNVTLYGVRGETFSDELETAVHNVIGRGRVVQYGTKYGKTGSLDVAFYDVAAATARAQRLAVEAIRDSGLAAYMRNPFGDVWPVALIDFSVTRIPGVGNREYSTASVGYSEVDD